jgi:hypothetical protein
MFSLINNKNKKMETELELQQKQGAFVESLQRNNKQIRNDRAIAITEDAEMIYKRTIEDMEIEVKRLKRERESLLDLSPTSADSLVLASDFSSKNFVEKDVEIGLKIRNLDIKLDIARERYKHLFGN